MKGYVGVHDRHLPARATGVQADAARVFELLVVPALQPAAHTSEKTREKRRKKSA